MKPAAFPVLPNIWAVRITSTRHGVSACLARRYWTQRTKTVHVPIWEPWYAARQPLAFVEPFAGKFVPEPEIGNEESS
jgi:hypothetical protein